MSSQEAIDILIAKQQIHDVMMRYCRGIDRHDVALAKSTYHSDAYDEHGPSRGNAHEVMDRVGIALSNLEISQHRISNMLIEIDGESAHAETYFHALHIEKGADFEEQVFGRYIDRFERREGEWKIAHRQVVLDYATCPPRAPIYPHKHAFAAGVRDQSDPGYMHLGRS